MPCLIYNPTKALTPSGANLYSSGSTRELCFKMSTPDIRLIQDKQEESTFSGRPCITSQSEDVLEVGVTAINLHTKDKPIWVEMIRSTGCGELLEVVMPCLDAWGAGPQCVITGTPSITVRSRLIFQVSFRLKFWDLL